MKKGHNRLLISIPHCIFIVGEVLTIENESDFWTAEFKDILKYINILLFRYSLFVIAEQIFIFPFTVKTPSAFLLAGEAGGINVAFAITSL